MVYNTGVASLLVTIQVNNMKKSPKETFQNMSANEKKQFARVSKILINSVARDALLTGRVIGKEFDDREALIRKIIKWLPKNFDNFKVVVMHGDSILKEAVKYSPINIQFSKIFYAMYFEHELNHIIYIQCKKRKLEKHVGTIIRHLGNSEKMGWLLSLLGLPNFSKKYVVVITRLLEDRNAFVHYKWTPTSIDKDERASWLVEEPEIKKAITYVRKYSSNIEFGGNKKKLKNLLK